MKYTALTFSFLLLLFTGCSVDQTEEGDLPEVEVDTESGDLPEYDVDWANVNVTTETETVEVPKVVVVMEEEEVEVPSISMNIPDKETVERELVVQAEITDTEKEINIQQIRASKNRLFVIATLEDIGTDLDDQTMRVQDQVKLNAPDDLDVRHYIIGNRPDRVFNNQYTYVNSMSALPSEVRNAQTIFER